MVSDISEELVSVEATTNRNLSGWLYRPTAGFTWTNRVASDDQASVMRWLVASDLPPFSDEPAPWAGFAPMKDANCDRLHRKFARLASGSRSRFEESAVAFASKYGWLSEQPDDLYVRDTRKQKSTLGESLNFWKAEACECGALVALWELIENRKHGALGELVLVRHQPLAIRIRFGWAEGKFVPWNRFIGFGHVTAAYPSEDPSFYGDPIAGGETDEGRWRLGMFPKLDGANPDLFLAAKLWLIEQINRKLWGNVTVQTHLSRAATVQVLQEPRSLLGAIYLHFAKEVAGTESLGMTCQYPLCGKPLEEQNGRGRPRRFCSPKCQKANDSYWRRREQKA